MVNFIVLEVGKRLVPYSEGLELQSELHKKVSSGVAPDTVILLEHESVYTAGKRTEPAERPSDGTPVIDVDRGGKITWHGPGQLIGYPIIRLDEPIDVVGYVRQLETMLISVVGTLGIDAHRVKGRSGVWVTTGTVPSKIGAIGIRVAAGTTSHGFALNCSNSLEPYSKILACGIRDAKVSSISDILGRHIGPSDVIDLIMEQFTVSQVAA
jgi:lipoyl(octanoyl) transferase